MTIADTDRRRQYTWSDPAELAAAATGVDGLTFLQWLADGTLPPPPILHTLGGTLVAVAHGEATFELDAQEYHYNPIGSVHGGVYATLLDSACGCAVQPRCPRAPPTRAWT